jgi:hypothetical protein
LAVEGFSMTLGARALIPDRRKSMALIEIVRKPALAFAAAAMVAVGTFSLMPSAAEARHRGGGWHHGGWHHGHWRGHRHWGGWGWGAAAVGAGLAGAAIAGAAAYPYYGYYPYYSYPYAYPYAYGYPYYYGY